MLVLPESPTPTEVGAYYDKLDQYYRVVWGEHLHHGIWTSDTRSARQAITNLIDYAADWIAPKPAHHLADAGCGYGATANYLNTRFGCQVTGYTVSANQYCIGKKLGLNPGVTLRQHDWLQPEGDDNVFDGLISLECLCHVTHKRLFFQRIFESLKPGARAAITTLTVSQRGMAYFEKNLLHPLCQGALFPSLGLHSELENWPRTVGLRLLDCHDLTPMAKRTWTAIFAQSIVKLPSAWIRRELPPRFGRIERRLAANAFRMKLAYALGALEYRLIIVEKP